MISDDNMAVLEQQFQRIFTLPVTRLTFRELQSAISTALNEDTDAAQSVSNALLTDDYPDNPRMESFFKEYAVPFKVAKQIQDNGEVLSMLSTDIGSQGDVLLFQVRIRRIDGGEFTFVTDATGFIQVAEHIISRIATTKNSLAGKGTISTVKPRLEALEKTIRKVLE